MIITGEDIGKKFGKTWIFRHQHFEIKSGEKTAITGKNGAGKSTMLQIIAGYLTQSKGHLKVDGINIDDSSHSTAFIGPYTEIIEEFSLREFLAFHSKFRTPICELAEMANAASLPLDKIIGDFSTGMKQRAKLLTAFYFKNDALLMDEPTSNLDDEGFDWWKKELEKSSAPIIIIASNDKREIMLCNSKLIL